MGGNEHIPALDGILEAIQADTAVVGDVCALVDAHMACEASADRRETTIEK
jgi:hypothetical protein